MSNYKEILLARVCALCDELLSQRMALARTQERISDTARKNANAILNGYDRARKLDPFPEEGTVDESPLEDLKTALADPSSDPEDREQIIMDWLQGIAPFPLDNNFEKMDAPVISPANQRMLDATMRLRSTIDTTRVRLMTTDRYDRDAYKAARNDFTLSRSVFDQRLRNNNSDIDGEDTARAEGPLKDKIASATGETFPDAIQAAADFMRERVFVAA